ncbi:Asp-tRNA(Asn)/Glu-tRNA(Gln) amidotransferase subunit GatC [Legionella impletisoli]|uniref:Aspartyl/glutamyl-tRNA(Asn/Gln) amidotransferase subunit C n=1 Tax=Legionella impletisoli TaxID=343510 RepID=A0A917JLR6_9GAMM|nr:Asp-tRNA(Asn)/Glu-tRNA(Gln) amidotransferase subunit GatC [Legionella impletisoli]GGI75560.1 aspartyl/glutamyl-tRNA(Asn/Gln) amidotransferase subunit C [Legionella impletisoli]
MFTSETELQKLASLAYIKLDAETRTKLAHDVSAIMEFVEQLRSINTQEIKPLFHPLDMQQRLREDVCDEPNRVEYLAEIAPLFENDHYLVPKVIEIGK